MNSQFGICYCVLFCKFFYSALFGIWQINCNQIRIVRISLKVKRILICCSNAAQNSWKKRIGRCRLLSAIWGHQHLGSHRAQQIFWVVAHGHRGEKWDFFGKESSFISSTCYAYLYLQISDPNYSALQWSLRRKTPNERPTCLMWPPLVRTK